MPNTALSIAESDALLHWLPDDIRLYLRHTEAGVPIRAIARDRGVHASTVLRQVRKTESRRDDPLVDALLARLGARLRDVETGDGAAKPLPVAEDDPVAPQILRCLRAMAVNGAFTVVSQGVDTAVVLRPNGDGDPVAQAKAPSWVIEMMALQGWIEGEAKTRLSKYRISAEGRKALNRMMAEAEGRAVGFAEAPARFDMASSKIGGARAHGAGKRASGQAGGSNARPAGADSPVRVLGRAKGRAKPYLSAELVASAERFQRDFALGQFDVAARGSWDAIMSAPKSQKGSQTHESGVGRQIDARKRLTDALRAMGPELGEITLAVCCHEKGMERIEAELAMPARSGKYMLRVALNYLDRHYKSVGGDDHELVY